MSPITIKAYIWCHRQDLPIELLDDQADDEILSVTFLRHNQEDCAFIRAEFLRVYGRVKAQNLLQLRIQKSVQSGKSRGENALHGLLRGVERRPREPFCLVVIRQMGKEQLEQGPSLDAAWSRDPE